MKKLLVSAIVIASLTSCHFRQDEAKETLERNEIYKTEKAEFSVHRAGEYGKPENASSVAVDTTAVADTTTTK